MKTNDFNSNNRKPYTSPTMKVVEMELESLMNDVSGTGQGQTTDDPEWQGQTNPTKIFRGLIDDTDMEYFEDEY